MSLRAATLVREAIIALEAELAEQGELSSFWHEEADGLAAELAEAQAARDKYHDTLLSKHGGEPLALLDELDEARAAKDKWEWVATHDLLYENGHGATISRWHGTVRILAAQEEAR